MKATAKSVTMWLFVHGLISSETVTWIFARINLKHA